MPVAVIRVSRMWPKPQQAEMVTSAQPSESDGLDAFGSESEPERREPLPTERRDPPATERREPLSSEKPRGPSEPVMDSSARTPASAGSRRLWVLVGILGVLLSGTGVWQYQQRRGAVVPGSLSINTNPSGLEVVIGGSPVGRTPLTISLQPGPHVVHVGPANQGRELRIDMVSGANIQHTLDIAPEVIPSPAVSVGALQVQSDVSGMPVVVDGVERGKSPLVVSDLSPGEHQVAVRVEQRVIRRTVTVKAGETVSLVLSTIAPAVAAPGWLAISSPMIMQLRENGQLIGTTEAEKIMLPAGDHDIEIANESIGFRETRRITVVGGKVASTAIALPTGLLSINAQPWAEVWVDGERIGETPIANLAARLGTHEVVFRHPQLGERRQSILVTLQQPARLGVDLRSKP